MMVIRPIHQYLIYINRLVWKEWNAVYGGTPVATVKNLCRQIQSANLCLS